MATAVTHHGHAYVKTGIHRSLHSASQGIRLCRTPLGFKLTPSIVYLHPLQFLAEAIYSLAINTYSLGQREPEVEQRPFNDIYSDADVFVTQSARTDVNVVVEDQPVSLLTTRIDGVAKITCFYDILSSAIVMFITPRSY